MLNHTDMSFSEDARQAFALAKEHADRLGHDYFGVEHMLLGIFDLSRGGAKAALDSRGIDRGLVRSRLECMLPIGKEPGNRGELPYTPANVALLKNAMEEARSAGGTIVTTSHLLLAALMNETEAPCQAFREAAIGIPELVAAARRNLADG